MALFCQQWLVSFTHLAQVQFNWYFNVDCEGSCRSLTRFTVLGHCIVTFFYDDRPVLSCTVKTISWSVVSREAVIWSNWGYWHFLHYGTVHFSLFWLCMPTSCMFTAFISVPSCLSGLINVALVQMRSCFFPCGETPNAIKALLYTDVIAWLSGNCYFIIWPWGVWHSKYSSQDFYLL